MSSLVSDLLLNPVLRQARRFSRSSYSGDHDDPVSAEQLPRDTLDATNLPLQSRDTESASVPAALNSNGSSFDSVSGRPLVSSPVDEHPENEVGLPAPEGISFRRNDTIGHSSAVPLRLASLRSEVGLSDDEMSDNPSFGIPERFQTASSMSSTLNISSGARVTPVEGPTRMGTQDSVQSASNHHRNSSLPEDDGMGELRKKIVQIQAMDTESETKAMMMHQVLTHDYNRSQSSLHVKPPRPHSPASMTSQEMPATPGSLSSFSFWQGNNETSSGLSLSTPNHGFQLSPDDLRPTFAPIPPQVSNQDGEDDDTQDGTTESGGAPIPQLGCKHYRRKVKLQCSTCDRWYTCRFCHDEVEDHMLNRRETKNMLCMLCGCAQRASEICVNCGVTSAWYYCAVCHLWDDDASKSIYHCDDCGICRVGRGLGKDYMHCKTCGVCILISKDHKCVERASDCDCPICGEYLFNSPQTVVFMKCGHTIHQVCYKDLMKTTYKCPLCSQSVVNMETQFRNLDRAIESQPMPPQFQDTQAMISCNDCYAKSLVKYHWLGLRCAVCDSYNTAQLQIMSNSPIAESGPSEADIIPGPRADIFLEDVIALAQRRTAGPFHNTRPLRRRRHSSHAERATGMSQPSSRFSPYPMPQRIARSVSPLSGIQFSEEPMAMDESAADAVVSEDEDDVLDFWGRDMSPRRIAGDMEDEEDDDSDDNSSSDMDDDEDDDDDGDGVDRMDLVGHR